MSLRADLLDLADSGQPLGNPPSATIPDKPCAAICRPFGDSAWEVPGSGHVRRDAESSHLVAPRSKPRPRSAPTPVNWPG